ncbi:hypothetical protein HGM15179_001912 [Zosterops borbonicus]|uniref:Uncharacterized protein n=1 Tax=Zosterops borbonicus TaxID=364589 RepID=A0A8K1GWQ3_9PASS|nr:hypothetical protein HGM15179_001912 [Zosterops borbonicus]
METEPAAPAPSRAEQVAAAGSLLETTWNSEGEMKYGPVVDDLGPFPARDTEQSQGVSKEHSEQGLSRGDVSRSRGRSGWVEYLEDWLPLVPVSSREDISDCKENIGGGVSRGNVSGSSGPSSWDDDSHEEPVQGNPEVATQHGNGTKALLPDDEDWDDALGTNHPKTTAKEAKTTTETKTKKKTNMKKMKATSQMKKTETVKKMKTKMKKKTTKNRKRTQMKTKKTEETYLGICRTGIVIGIKN